MKRTNYKNKGNKFFKTSIIGTNQEEQNNKDSIIIRVKAKIKKQLLQPYRIRRSKLHLKFFRETEVFRGVSLLDSSTKIYSSRVNRVKSQSKNGN
jgi:hypothetical protein